MNETSADLPIANVTSVAAETADTAKPANAKKLGNLRMVWQHASAYPQQIMFALLALTVAALATLAIPAGFRLVIDRGFAAGGDSSDIARWFEYLLIIVAVMATATAFRFYLYPGSGSARLPISASL